MRVPRALLQRHDAVSALPCVWTRFHILFRQVVILARPYPRAELQRSRLDPELPFKSRPTNGR
jgi:hypothetical protein